MRALSAVPRQAAQGRRVPRRGCGIASSHVAVDLSPQAVERVAAQVVRLLRENESRGEPELLSAGELARRLRVERPWVYRHRQLLGGLRIGVGPKAPWRFEYGTAVEALRRQQATQQKCEGL